MTDLDLAAIKARADAAADYGDAADQVRSAADVPALLARITELEAERDEELRGQRDAARADAEHMRLVLAIEGGGVDPDGYYAGTPGSRLQDLLFAEGQCDAMRPVVEAAEAYVANSGYGYAESKRVAEALIAAVAAHTLATATPAVDDVPASGPAIVDRAAVGALPSVNESLYAPGATPLPLISADEADNPQPVAKNLADPAGLDAAIEACPFCAIITGNAPAEVVAEWDQAIAIVPLNPVTPGHLLVIPRKHVADIAVHPTISAMVMGHAARLAREVGPCNIITSRGRDATQTVGHLHLHVVPRRPEDGLALPWSAPHLVRGERAAALREAADEFARDWRLPGVAGRLRDLAAREEEGK